MRDLSAREAQKARKQGLGIAIGGVASCLGIEEVSLTADRLVDYQGNHGNVDLIVNPATFHTPESSKRSIPIVSAGRHAAPPTSPAS
jgi:hypothetical protein